MASWNAQALMSRDPHCHLQEWRVLQRLATRSDVICIQETHADASTTKGAAARLGPTHRALHSAGQPSTAGGLLTLIRHSVLVDAEVHTVTLQAGRIPSVRATYSQQRDDIDIVNIHNHDVTTDSIRQLSRHLAESTAGERRAEVFVLGDWNLPEDGVAGLTTSQRGSSRPSDAGRERRRWGPVLRQVTELTHGRPTRAAMLATSSGPAITHNSLDRMATTIPPTTMAMTLVQISAGPISGAIGTPTFEPPSDHIPVVTTLRVRPPPLVARRPIPPWVVRTRRYKPRGSTRYRTT